MGSFFPSDFRFDCANAIWGHARVRQESLMKCIYDGWFITIIYNNNMMYSSSNEPCPALSDRKAMESPSEMEQKNKKNQDWKPILMAISYRKYAQTFFVQSVPPSFLDPEDLPLTHGSFVLERLGIDLCCLTGSLKVFSIPSPDGVPGIYEEQKRLGKNVVDLS